MLLFDTFLVYLNPLIGMTFTFFWRAKPFFHRYPKLIIIFSEFFSRAIVKVYLRRLIKFNVAHWLFNYIRILIYSITYRHKNLWKKYSGSQWHALCLTLFFIFRWIYRKRKKFVRKPKCLSSINGIRVKRMYRYTLGGHVYWFYISWASLGSPGRFVYARRFV